MSLTDDFHAQEALDEAIKLLYQSRPAKAAALLGLVDPTNPISLAPKVEEAKLGSLSGQGIPGAGPTAFDSPSGFKNQVQMNSYINQEPIKAVTNKVKDDLVGRPRDISPAPIGDNNSSSSAMSPIAKGASLYKRAMSDEEYLMYQAGMGPMMEHTGDPALTPAQLAAMGGGTVAVAGANRMRAKNVAGRELKQIRKQYIDAVQQQALTSQQLSNLNAELKLRGARPALRMVPTAGMADAYMAQAEKSLTDRVLKSRYRGALPMLAAGLIGTLAYNKLNEV